MLILVLNRINLLPPDTIKNFYFSNKVRNKTHNVDKLRAPKIDESNLCDVKCELYDTFHRRRAHMGFRVGQVKVRLKLRRMLN